MASDTTNQSGQADLTEFADGTEMVPRREPGHDLVPTRRGPAEPPAYVKYRTAFAAVDEARAGVEEAEEHMEAAHAELAAAERLWSGVENRVHELWWELRGRLGRRGRALEALPHPEDEALAGIYVDGLLDEAAAEVQERGVGNPLQRVPAWLIMPVSAAVFGALGFLFARLWLDLTGTNVAGALGLIALVVGPLAGVVVGLRARAYRDGEPVETEPWPALLGFGIAAATEVGMHFLIG